MKQTGKLFLVLAGMFIALTLTRPALANSQNSVISGATDWLLSDQNSDGTWAEGPRRFEDTYEALG
ncbi:MAG: hypothetical protein OEU95_02710, partial [Nitrospirota bacterium]|nr:hypothetical protein [Nitrospirota bacterium]